MYNLQKNNLKSQKALNNLMDASYQAPFSLFEPAKLSPEIKKVNLRKYWPRKSDVSAFNYDGDMYIGKFLYKKFSFSEIEILHKVNREKFNLFNENIAYFEKNDLEFMEQMNNIGKYFLTDQSSLQLGKK